MASVHLAQLRGDHHFTKWVAMKVVHTKHAGDERFEKMFLSEARLVARIDHPNVAQVFDCGTIDGTCYLAMEFLSGQTLHALLAQAAAKGERMPLPVVARVIANTALGLHAAHELHGEDGEIQGIVHRDVSPQNIFVLYSGQTKLMDFGIAYASQRETDEELTKVGELKGKFAYMSPEQMVKDPLDRRSDIFSLGIVLWEAACGMRLFKRRTEAETAMAVMSDEVPPPSSMVDGFPENLEKIIMRTLRKKPDERFETALELAEALEQYIASTQSATGSPQVARYVASIFPSERGEHTTTLRRAAVLLDEYEDTPDPTPSRPSWESELDDDYDLLEATQAKPSPLSRALLWPAVALVLGAGGLWVLSTQLGSETAVESEEVAAEVEPMPAAPSPPTVAGPSEPLVAEPPEPVLEEPVEPEPVVAAEPAPTPMRRVRRRRAPAAPVDTPTMEPARAAPTPMAPTMDSRFITEFE